MGRIHLKPNFCPGRDLSPAVQRATRWATAHPHICTYTKVMTCMYTDDGSTPVVCGSYGPDGRFQFRGAESRDKADYTVGAKSMTGHMCMVKIPETAISALLNKPPITGLSRSTLMMHNSSRYLHWHKNHQS